VTASTPLTIRLAGVRDALALGGLAQLDSAVVPAAPVLVAESDGELLAAVSLLDGASVADPFRPTADVVALLRARAKRIVLEGTETADDVERGAIVPARAPARAQALASAH
jgi:hypothetical protein